MNKNNNAIRVKSISQYQDMNFDYQILVFARNEGIALNHISNPLTGKKLYEYGFVTQLGWEHFMQIPHDATSIPIRRPKSLVYDPRKKIKSSRRKNK